MEITLPPDVRSIIDEKLASREFNSASELVAEAVRLFSYHDAVRKMKLESLRRDLQEGLDDIARGDVGPFDLEGIYAEIFQKTESEKADRVA